MSKRLAMLEQLLDKGSSDPFHHYARALELRSLDRPLDALEALVGVIERFPDYVPSYLMAAQVAHQLGRLEDARAHGMAGCEAARRAGDGHALSELEAFVAGL